MTFAPARRLLLSSGWIVPVILAFALPALAQPQLPPVRRPNPNVRPNASDRRIQPGQPTATQPTTPGAATPAAQAEELRLRNCEEVRRKAKFSIYFDKVDVEKLVQTVADATCRTFILPENVRGKISIIGPENGRVEVSANEFYAAFLSALDANGLAVASYGRFLKIVDKRSAKQSTIPTYVDPGANYTTNDQMITKLFKIRFVEIEPLRGVLQQLVSKDGDTIPYAPDTIIVNDIGSNMARLEKVIKQLDARSSNDEVRTIQIQYAAAQDVAATIQKIFEPKGGTPGRPGTPRGAPPRGPGVVGPPPPGAPVTPEVVEAGAEGAGPVTLSQIIPDERTNKLIIVASPAAFDRIQSLIQEIDVPISGGEGRINVYYLENANSEDLASTLQSLSQGQSSPAAGARRGPTAVPAQGTQAAGGRQPATSAELFAGEVKISADAATNSLVIIASQNDYRNLVRVIEKLDIPRRQVFVEAVIMEVNLDRNSEFGLNLHTGYSLNTPLGRAPGLIGTNYSGSGLPPSLSIASLAQFGGFLAGLQGPVIPELEKLGIDIPAFGVVLHALQQSSDVNVLSTPHILTSDNEEAEITVGQNVPFQAGFSPSSLGGLGAGLGAAGAAGVNPSLAGALGGLGSFFAPITRQNVELKLTVKPQINESDFIRLVITEQTEEIASTDPVLGPTTSKRSAKTTVVAKDQETVVIGGIMQDRTIESTSKVPVLGDIPLLGHLFRQTNRRKVKTNLLLFLTPYIIKEQSDFREIFERKMNERQQFVEQFYGQVPGYDVAIDFSRKAGPFMKMTRAIALESQKVENGGPGQQGERLIGPAIPGPQGGGASAPAAPEGEVPPGDVIEEAPPQGDPVAPEVTEPPAGSGEPPAEELEVQPEAGG